MNLYEFLLYFVVPHSNIATGCYIHTKYW